MHSRADYVLLDGDDDEQHSSTLNIISSLLGNPIPRPVDVPEILISQHNNAMQFHYGNFNAVKTKMKHALRERNAAITEVARLIDIRDGRGMSLIKAYKHTTEDILPILETAVLNLAQPTILHNIDAQIDKERMTIRTKNHDLAALKEDLKAHKNEILKCYNKMRKIETTAESKLQGSEQKEKADTQSSSPYLQMSH